MHVGDRPADVTQRRLANSISGSSGGRLAAALGLLLTGVITATTHVVPDVEAAAAAVTGSSAAGDAGIVAAAAAGALALAWPVLSPFAEVWQFSRLDGSQVEDTVAIKQPLQVMHVGLVSDGACPISPLWFRIALISLISVWVSASSSKLMLLLV